MTFNESTEQSNFYLIEFYKLVRIFEFPFHLIHLIMHLQEVSLTRQLTTHRKYNCLFLFIYNNNDNK